MTKFTFQEANCGPACIWFGTKGFKIVYERAPRPLFAFYADIKYLSPIAENYFHMEFTTIDQDSSVIAISLTHDYDLTALHHVLFSHVQNNEQKKLEYNHRSIGLEPEKN